MSNNMVKLGDIASFKTGPFGTQLSAKEYTSSGTPVINVKNIGYGSVVVDGIEYVGEATTARLSEHLLKKGDIVFGRKGSVDRHAYIDDNCVGWMQGSDCIRVRCVDGVNARYVSHYLKLDFARKQITNAAVGSTMASLNVDILKEISINLPPIETQEKIEKFFTSLENRIVNNNLVSAALFERAKTIYDYWFIQFDFPNTEGKPYKSSGGEMIWCEELQRDIPKGWFIGCIEDLGTIVSGGTPSTAREDYYTDDGIAWITPNDLSSREKMLYIRHGERDITEDGLKGSSATLMPAGSILFSTRAPIGYIAIAENEVCTNQGFKSVVPNKGYEKYFIYYTIKRNTKAIAQQGVGTTFKEVSKDTFSKFKILLPPKQIVEAFEKEIEKGCQLRSVCERENDKLISYRDWLLPLLMNGQATIKQETTK